MPSKAAKFCAKCSRLAVSGGLCEVHQKQSQQQAYQRRDNKWLYLYHDPQWDRLRDAQLAKDPFCAECRGEHLLTPASVADHIKPHKGDPKLFYDADNLQSMCKQHHDRKTAKEDGGFGNPKIGG